MVQEQTRSRPHVLRMCRIPASRVGIGSIIFFGGHGPTRDAGRLPSGKPVVLGVGVLIVATSSHAGHRGLRPMRSGKAFKTYLNNIEKYAELENGQGHFR